MEEGGRGRGEAGDGKDVGGEVRQIAGEGGKEGMVEMDEDEGGEAW